MTSDRWGDLVDLFERPGPRGGRPVTQGCWCMWWRQRTGDGTKNKQAMGALVAEGSEPGLLAYEAGSPIGWVSVGPREEYGQLVRSRTYGPIEEEEGIFSIVCFYLDPPAKKRGIALALLEAARDYAIARGASSVEAYPGEDFMGKRETFERLGFTKVREAGKRSIMRHTRREPGNPSPA